MPGDFLKLNSAGSWKGFLIFFPMAQSRRGPETIWMPTSALFAKKSLPPSVMKRREAHRTQRLLSPMLARLRLRILTGLWPRQKVLDELLSILNREEMAGIWGEDETIGWVYQYFNSAEERKKMRDESAAKTWYAKLRSAPMCRFLY
jgi:hypothetical protein